MDGLKTRPANPRHPLALLLLPLLAIALALPASAAATVSNVKVSDSFYTDAANDFDAAPTEPKTYVYFTIDAPLGVDDAIMIEGPTGMEFPSAVSSYGISTGGTVYNLGGVQLVDDGRSAVMTLNESFSTPVDSRIRVQVSDATLPHTAGAYTLTASTSEEPADVTSSPFNILAGALDHLAATGGDAQSATVGTAFDDPIAVAAQDQYDNPIGGVDVTFTTPATGASGSFGEDGSSKDATTGTDGVASSGALTANTAAGVWEATAAAGESIETGFSLTNDPGSAASMTVGGGGQTAVAGSTFDDPLTAQVDDQYGNGVPGVSVVFSNPCGGGCGRFESSSLVATDTTDATGAADSGTVTAGNLGWRSETKPYHDWPVDISAGIGEALNDTVTLTNVPGPLNRLVSGVAFQSTDVGEAFANPVTVLATDRLGNPLEGVRITFTVPDSGASTSTTIPAEQITGADGRASTGAFAANTHAGFWQLKVGTDDPEVDTIISLENVADVPAHSTVTLDPASVPANGNATSNATITVTDRYDNPLYLETVELSAQGPGDLPTIGPVTDRWDGTYTAPITASATPGDFTIEATVDGYPAASGSATLTQLDIVAPTAEITQQPERKVKTKRKRAPVRFRFRADEPATLQCKLDRDHWKACESPLKLRLPKGRHTFKVRAIDAAGNRGPAAKAKVRVVRKKGKRKHRR